MKDKQDLIGLENVLVSLQVLVVEGEERMQWASDRLPDWMAVVTFPVVADQGEINWSPLFAKKVILWPHWDSTSHEIFNEIGAILESDVEILKIVDFERPFSSDEPKLLEWLADGIKEWSHAKVEPAEPQKKAAENAHKEAPRIVPDERNPPPSTRPPTPDQAAFSGPDEVMAEREKRFPFHILGQSDDKAYFLKQVDGRIVSHPLTSIPRKEVLGTLAPPQLWKDAFGGMTKDDRPIGWPTIGQAAQAHIMRSVEKLPEFSPEKTRGRGCWMHGDVVAFNRGDRIELDGKLQDTNYIDGLVYERGAPLPIPADQLTDEEGIQFGELIKGCAWAHEFAPLCLFGWIAIAPICGALTWRPHIWLTGPHGCGKSTIMDRIVRPAVGWEACIKIGGNTTEAGLRQTIRHDSIPVLLDETEAGKRGSQIAALLELARSASTGDTIVRGSANQDGAHHYHIRSAFCFSAINPAIERAADESRITRLPILKADSPADDERYKVMFDGLSNLMGGNAFGYRLCARMIAMAPLVMRNIAKIEDAITARFGSRRLAQQFGAMFGGAHSLKSKHPITEAEANDMASMVPESSVNTFDEDDAQRMIQHFLSYQLDVPAPKSGHMKITIGELIERLSTVMCTGAAADMPREDAMDIMKRWGLAMTEIQKGRGFQQFAVIAKKHPSLQRLFKDTAWAHSYPDRFKDLRGGKEGKQRRFTGARYSTIMVPLSQLMDDDTEEEEGEGG